MTSDPRWGLVWLLLRLTVVPIVVVLWVFMRRYLVGEVPKIQPMIDAIAARMDEIFPGAHCQASMRAMDGSPASASIVLYINRDVFPRLEPKTQFIFDLPLEAMRPMGRRRSAICAAVVGEPTEARFAAFAREHVRPLREMGAMVPVDIDRLIDLQAVVWAEAFRHGWPVLCPDVSFERLRVTFVDA